VIGLPGFGDRFRLESLIGFVRNRRSVSVEYAGDGGLDADLGNDTNRNDARDDSCGCQILGRATRNRLLWIIAGF
jgi:hypothetical protein